MMMTRGTQLNELIERARKHKMTPLERRAQRVSLIMGLRSTESSLSREKVEEVLDEVEGRDPVMEDTTNR